MRLTRPLQYEVVWIERGERRVVQTHSHDQAKVYFHKLRDAGHRPSLYIGNLELARA